MIRNSCFFSYYEGTLTFNVMFSHQSPVIYIMYTHKISFLSKLYGMSSYFCRKNNFHFSFQVNFFNHIFLLNVVHSIFWTLKDFSAIVVKNAFFCCH